MASIPTYQSGQIRTDVVSTQTQSIASPGLFNGMTRANEISDAGAGLGAVGVALQKHALDLQQKEDTAFATTAESGFLNKITDFKIQSRNRQGLNATSLPEEADKFYAEAAKETLDAAPNERVKAAMQVIIAKHQPGFHGYIGAHAAEQLDKAADDGVQASIASQISAASADPNEAPMAKSRVVASINALANTKGWDAETKQAAILAKTSELHTGVINALLVNNPSKAQAYYTLNKEEIEGKQRTTIETHMKATVDAEAAMAGADSIWGMHGPKQDGQPVQLDVMEAEARKMYAGDPAKIKETVAEIRSRASAFNSSETERAASNVNKVMEAYASGVPLSKLKAMPEFLSLPGDKKATISDHIDNKIQANLNRAATMEARRDAEELRAERKRHKGAFSAYLAYSNPDVLATLTENQIIAMIPDMGEDKVNSLMNQKRALSVTSNKPSKLIEAKMDSDDFNKIATGMGFRPFKPQATEDEKAALGELRFRVDHVLQQYQAESKVPLTREQKVSIMKTEAARAVTLEGGWFSSNKQVPVLAMTPEDVDRVVIPPAERKQAAIRLQKLRKRFPEDANYEPTERNLRMMYLQSISPAAEFIDGN